MSYGYDEALKAAGADLLAFEAFGSYHGDWWAKVRFEGKTFWVHGDYGSCVVCDAFEAEFPYAKEYCNQHYNSSNRLMEKETCPDCETVRKDYDDRLAKFGLSYLTAGEFTQQEAEDFCKKETFYWDRDETEKMLNFVRENRNHSGGSMTPEEAVKVLEENDYCIKHLIEKKNHTEATRVARTCAKCDEEETQRWLQTERLRRQRIEEAINVLKQQGEGK